MKRKKIRKIMQCALLMLVCLLLAPVQAAGAAVELNPTISVGLFYGNTALPGANLLNSVGEGYRFGYLDSGRNYNFIGYTSEKAVSVVKTQNVCYSTVDSWAGYYDTVTSSITVGSYHLQVPGSFAGYQEAANAAAAYQGGFVAWIDGVYCLRVGSYPDSTTAEIGLTAQGLVGATIVSASENGVSVVQTGSSKILFQFDSTQGLSLAIKPGLDDTVKTKTVFRGRTYEGTFQYQRLGGGNITVSNILPLEDYVQGVIVQEMSPSWPLEALKAQAICARTYGYRCVLQTRHTAQGFDICNTVDCQAYVGVATASANSTKAVEDTYGQYLWYNGELATDTVYFSHDGGATEDSKNVWSSDVPYLKGKVDPHEAAVVPKIANYNWTVTYTKQQLTDLMNSKGYANAGIANFQVTKTTPTGNVLEISFTDIAGKTWTKSKESARTFLGLRSLRYNVSTGGTGTGAGATNQSYSVTGGDVLSGLNGVYAIDGSGTATILPGGSAYVITGNGVTALAPGVAPPVTTTGDAFVITGSGWGHNVGMSQWGAYAMAQSGHTYDQILAFYYTGIEVRTP